MDNTKDMLTNQIDTEIQNLATMESGSEEKSKAVEDLAKLYRLKIEETKVEKECLINKDGCENQKLVDRARLGLEAAGIIIPMIFYSVWMKKGFKFEETGTFTSSTFKGLTKFFKPFKR